MDGGRTSPDLGRSRLLAGQALIPARRKGRLDQVFGNLILLRQREPDLLGKVTSGTLYKQRDTKQRHLFLGRVGADTE